MVGPFSVLRSSGRVSWAMIPRPPLPGESGQPLALVELSLAELGWPPPFVHNRREPRGYDTRCECPLLQQHATTVQHTP